MTQPASATAWLQLLQLASPALPVGAFSYSEGLEVLVQTGQLTNAAELQHWLTQELHSSAIRVEAGVLARCYACVRAEDWVGLQRWNHWLSAFRETEEIRLQSWQMGRSLQRLLLTLEPATHLPLSRCGEECNFATAFAIAAATWQIDETLTLLAYLHSWTTNLVNAAVKLVPLGQTQGQQVLLQLYPALEETAAQVQLQLADDLFSSGWGLAIASMHHKTLYSRLFRS